MDIKYKILKRMDKRAKKSFMMAEISTRCSIAQTDEELIDQLTSGILALDELAESLSKRLEQCERYKEFVRTIKVDESEFIKTKGDENEK